MAPYLTDCALNSGFDARARSAAASCLYHLITKFQKPDAADCLSRIALRDNVVPTIIEAADNLKVASNVTAEKAMMDLCEALDVAALLVRLVRPNHKCNVFSFYHSPSWSRFKIQGTAAACRGKSSSKIADDVSNFLIQLSCDGKAQAPFASDACIVDFSASNEAKLHFAASSSFGAMVSIEDGGPFWRQRLMHLSSKHLLQASNSLDTKSMLSAEALTPNEIGRLLIACFVIASGGVKSLGDSSLNAMADRIMLDFSRIYAEGSETNAAMKDLGTSMFSVKEMVLAAVVTLMAVAPRTVRLLDILLCPAFARRTSCLIHLRCSWRRRWQNTTRHWCRVFCMHTLIHVREIRC